jgi:two-component system, chemotaxis family, CheB/CheR fusion protein
MPASAIASGAVDLVLSPKKIAAELIRMGKKGYLKPGPVRVSAANEPPDNDPGLEAILHLLRKNTKIDFSHYKMNTIKRRLFHRMAQHDIKTLGGYFELLSGNSPEILALSRDLLINVTSFFRDNETFSVLKKTYLRQLFKNRNDGAPLRVWVPACSTGEEVYSIAMIIAELQSNNTRKIPVQIYATDISEDVINIARRGVYAASDLKDVSPARIKKFFTREGNNYHIIKALREMCVYAVHNILSDPPFSRMDLISCRNLLIYFDPAAQKRALTSLHFALNDNGFLLLGKSESIAGSLLFIQQNNKYKIFTRRRDKGIRKVPELVPGFSNKKNSQPSIYEAKSTSLDYPALNTAIDSILLSEHMPACAVINKDMEILHFRGNTTLYLAHPQGKATLNIFKMTRPEFAFELRSAVISAIKTKQPVSKDYIEMLINGKLRTVSLKVHPLPLEWNEPLLLVVFTADRYERAEAGDHRKNGTSAIKDLRMKKMSEELKTMRAEMHTIIDSQEIAYEKLQAANEEIISSNEEFQTLNEELETTKEEIEASNEELTTTNQELSLRNKMLTESNNFSEAIINTLHEPMIILNSRFYVKSANKAFYKIFNANKEATEGVSVFDLGNKQWDILELHQLLEKILFKNASFNGFKVRHTFPQIGEKVMLLNASRIEQITHGEQLILLAIDDITELTHQQEIEKKVLNSDIEQSKNQNELLERAVKKRTRQIAYAQKILEEKNAELEIVNKDLTSFSYISSHDLQEPLRKIQIFSSLILKEEEQNLSANGKVNFQKIQDTAGRMQGLLNAMLAYSRTKTMESNYEKTSLKLIVDDVIKDFDDVIKQKNAVIEYGRLCEIHIISFQFAILFSNLIGNALKFSDSHRTPHIRITCRMVAGAKIKTPKLSPDRNYCRLVVEDNGIGFDNQYKERIFEVFQRLNGVEAYEGTGIGLAICRRIVDNHNGIIVATGKLNKGARFDIYIPA